MKRTGGRELPMLPQGVNLPGCRECGACCRDIDILLTQEELHRLDEDGTTFVIRRGPNAAQEPAPDGRQLYHMVGWCGNLACDPTTGTFSCRIYNDPGRPAICDEFPEGGANCRGLQAQRGVITEEHLLQPGAEQYLTELVFGDAPVGSDA